jgi:hypothetical protein
MMVVGLVLNVSKNCRSRARRAAATFAAMSLPRARLFEFNDSDWAPPSLRDFIHESITRSIAWGRSLSGLVAPFETFVAAARVREVLELGAGVGGPARALTQAIRRAGRVPPRFVLTDLRPAVDAWQTLCAQHPEDLGFEPTPVDATHIPTAIANGRARLLINALHHFPPELAQQLFADAVATGNGIFIAEPFDRNPLRLMPLMAVAVLSFLAAPFFTTRARLQKALWFLSLVGPLASLWDGIVSTLRVYDEAELRAMVAPLGDRFTWTFGHHHYGLGGRGYYFWGVPRLPGG